MDVLFAIIALIIVAGIITAARSIKTVQQYEDAIVFRFGRVLPGVRQPGLTIIRPIGDKIVKVNKQIIAMGVPATAWSAPFLAGVSPIFSSSA